MSPNSQLLQVGLTALEQGRYAEAIQALNRFCQTEPQPQSRDYWQAQVSLAKAYQRSGQLEAAYTVCQRLVTSQHGSVRIWGQQALEFLAKQLPPQPDSPPSPPPPIQSDATPSIPPPQAPIAQVSLPHALPLEMAPVPTVVLLTVEQATALFNQGNKALRQERYADAIAAFTEYCQGAKRDTRDYTQAQIALVKAYRGNGQLEDAIALCRDLVESPKETVQLWAKKYLAALQPEPEIAAPEPPAEPAHHSPGKSSRSPSPDSPSSLPKAGRSPKIGVSLAMKGITANLPLASGITLSLLFGMILVLTLGINFIVLGERPLEGFLISLLATLVINTGIFFLSPIFMDLIQSWLYGTRWVTLPEIERYSPETGQVIRRICEKHHLKMPRLGLINDENPTAFTYGSLPNTARLVVSQGLFTYLDEDEIATVYAHEFGHIVHWDFAVMTLAATLVQIMYLIYTASRETAERLGNDKVTARLKKGLESATLFAYLFYIAGEYILLYLSRVREYYADRFAAEITGNPNGLSRALVKIAYGILEQGQRNSEPSKLIQGTRALGIYDGKAALFTGTAYRVASEPQKVGKVFLWDLVNPWAWLMELGSTHPLTGKRVRALTTYAEQLGLDTEFDMAQVIRESHKLSKQRLYGDFVLDMFLYQGDKVGSGLGFMLGTGVVLFSPAVGLLVVLSLMLIGYGLGLLLKTLFMYPDFQRAPETDVLALMSDPYASPLRGKPVKLSGEVIGRGDSGYRYGSDLKLQDPTGMLFVRYASRFGPLGNFLFGMNQAESFIHQPVRVLGWFRRGVSPWLDLIQMDCETKWTVNSYHRFWSLISALGAIAIGFVLPSLLH